MKISLFGLATLVCWCLFAVFWVIRRSNVKKDIHDATAEQKVMSVIGSVFYFILLYWPLFFAPAKHTIQTYASGFAGLIICVMGISLSIWATLVQGRDWSNGVAIKESYDLIIKGPYNVVRHPIYTGFILALLGSAIAVGHLSGFIALGIVLLGLVPRIGRAEKMLSSRFPDDFESYTTRSKKLIPFIW